MDRKDLYNPDVYAACLTRIEQLNAGSKPSWGSMSVAQMFAHCAAVQEAMNGKKIEGTPWFVKLFKGMVRKAVTNTKPYKKNTTTHPAYKQTSEKEFQEEKLNLLRALKTFHEMDKTKAKQTEHFLFGTMPLDEKGWAMYKHLDHHLQQFGV